MGNIINWNDAIKKGIVSDGVSKEDRLDKINYFLEEINKKHRLDYLIQSNMEYRKDRREVHCMIGYAINEGECGTTIANGLGDNIEQALINAINEFIEYYNINKDLLEP